MTADQREGIDSVSVDEDTLVLAMASGRDRDLLADWLATFPRYQVITATAPSELPAEYDLCVVGAASLSAFRAELSDRTAESGSVYLPHMLAVPGGETEWDQKGTAVADLDDFVSDVVTLPLNQASLHRRVENLLQARRASVHLAEREQQYRRLVELTPETILLVDDGTIVYANVAAAELFAVSDRTAVVGEPLSEFVELADEETLTEVLTDIQTDGEQADAEFVELLVRARTGEQRHVALTGVEVVYDGRTVVQLVVRDLTEKKERKQRLTLFGRAMEAASQGIAIADARQEDDPIVYANEGFQRITGYPLEEILGRNCRFLQGEGTDDEKATRIREAIAAERAVSLDILNYRKDGSPFWNRLDIVPVESDEGTVTHFLGLQRDVTEQKEREQQLSVLNRVLRHNLRNKMNIIQVYAQQLQDVDGAESAAHSIQSAAEQLLTISEQIRSFDSIVAADERDLQTVDLAGIVADGVTALRARNAETDITLTGPDTATIQAHETLEAALTDLVSLTETLDGPFFDLDITVSEGTVTLRVTDRGSGIERSDLDVVASDVETPLEHLQSLELWLIRWAVEESHGEFIVDTDAENPVVEMRFLRADSDGPEPDRQSTE